MATTSLPSLLLLLTTAQLLFGGGQTAFLQEPENPGRFQQNSSAVNIQYYEPFCSTTLSNCKCSECTVCITEGTYSVYIMDCLPIPSHILVITHNYFYKTKLLLQLLWRHPTVRTLPTCFQSQEYRRNRNSVWECHSAATETTLARSVSFLQWYVCGR